MRISQYQFLNRDMWKLVRNLTIAKANYVERCKFLAIKSYKLIKRHYRKSIIKVLVDIGGGRGTILKFLSLVLGVESAILVDISPKALKKALKNLHRICADAHYLPLRERVADIALMFSVLELLKNPQEALKEAKRILKNRGLIIIQVPNFNGVIELCTGIPFPSLWPNKLKTLVFKSIFKHSNINWNVTPKLIKRLASNSYLYSYNYNTSVTLLARNPLKKFLPTGFLIVVENN